MIIPSKIDNKTVTEIADFDWMDGMILAFYGKGLTRVIIPDTVMKIGGGAFNNNNLSDDSAFIYARNDKDGDGIAEIDLSTIVSYGGASKSVKIPNRVETIGKFAFVHSELTDVEISDSVETIEGGAFWGNKIKEVKIPDNVITIGEGAFAYNQLEVVTISNSIKTIEKVYLQIIN